VYRCQYTDTFRRTYQRLTLEEREAIKRAIQRLIQNPHHPGLRVKKVPGRVGVWEARASRDLRITFAWERDEIVLRVCGHHDPALRR
jgi:mRNA interferase RelE/StbE